MIDYNKLHLTIKGLENANDNSAILSSLYNYYSQKAFSKHPNISMELEGGSETGDFICAENAIKHIFHLVHFFPQYDYGKDIDWSFSPYNEIEWPSCMHRMFGWDAQMLRMYLSTSDERYAKGWMDLTADWIDKNTYEVTPLMHHDKWGNPWNVLQVGIRARRWAIFFPYFVKSSSMTPQFISKFLFSIHQHAKVMNEFEHLPKDNARICQTLGLLNIAAAFPEFKESKEWLDNAQARFENIVRSDVNNEGMSIELNLHYQVWCANMVYEADMILDSTILNTVSKKMNEIIHSMLFPDNSLPYFGDTGGWEKRSDHQKYTQAFLGSNPKKAPSRANPNSGYYMLNSFRDNIKISMAIKNSPIPSNAFHTQHDNGTFELFAFDRLLMSDSGTYSYKGGSFEREWFRQTKVHQTMTLNDMNLALKPKLILWDIKEDLQMIVIENESYPDFIHRRSVIFKDNSFFVILDEALGSVTGPIKVHFQFDTGPFVCSLTDKYAHSDHEKGANVLIKSFDDKNTSMLLEEGWVSQKLNKKEPRPAFCFLNEEMAPCFFVTLIIPYRDKKSPEADIQFINDFNPGDNRFECSIIIDEKEYTIKREI